MSKKTRTLMIIVIALIVICVIALALGIISASRNEELGDIPETSSRTEIVIGDISEQEFYYDIDGMLEIRTPYGNLNYISDFAENIEIEKEETETKMSLIFFYIAGERKVELFTVCFNQKERGFYFGDISTESGNVPFSIEMSDYTEEVADSKEEFNMVCILQEHVNDIIDSVVMDENFIRAN